MKIDLNDQRLTSDEEVGKRVREIRKWLRLSQELVAKFIEIPRTAISNIEAGDRKLGINELIKLSQLFHCTPHSLLGIAPLPMVLETELGPAKINTRGKSNSDPLSDRDAAEIANFRKFLDSISKSRTVAGQEIMFSEFNGRAPKFAADSLRATLKMESIPVDVYKILASLGVYLRFSSLGTLSGALLRDYANKGVFGIIVNSDQPEDRIRFSAAHEAGHLVLSHKPNEVEVRSPKGRKYDVEEKDADAFAGELLMPATELERDAKDFEAKITTLDVYQMSDRYQVSYAAMLRRLFDIGLISSGSYNDFSQVRPTDLEAKLAPRKKNNLKKISASVISDAAKELEEILSETGVVLDRFKRSPDWVRLLQEKAHSRYMSETELGSRGSEVREVYEEVALWVAKHQPLSFDF